MNMNIYILPRASPNRSLWAPLSRLEKRNELYEFQI